MASQAIILHDRDSLAGKPEYLRLLPSNENIRMFQAVGSFKRSLSHYVTVRKMTVDADRYFGVAAALPGGIAVSHNVAVHAGLRGFGQI